MQRSGFILFGLAIAMLATSANASTIVGSAEVIDGDSMSIGGMSVRLFGIDAPEGQQTCNRDGRSWPCGEAAAGKLRSMVEGKTLICRDRGTDQYGRIVAVCEAGGIELNKAMVAQGWATAFQAYSQDYVADEIRAKTARLGIWDSEFMLPADFRRTSLPEGEGTRRDTTRRAAAQRTAPPAVMGRCVIKGNRNRRGQWIYHLPGMPYYEATRAEEIFCSEGEAQAAGYRRAIVR